MHGIDGREEATGRGVAIVLQATLKRLSRDVKELRSAIQGFGNVGSFAARILHDMGARIVAVSTCRAASTAPKGSTSQPCKLTSPRAAS